MKLSREINGGLVVLAVMVTAGITGWVILKDGPSQNWDSCYYSPPQQGAWNFSPGIMPTKICTSCHPVVSTVPNVRATSTLHHDHRGICSNCHRMANQSRLKANPGSIPAAIPRAAVGQLGGTNGFPVIRAGAVPIHADRGVCTNCHTVVSSRGNPIPTVAPRTTAVGQTVAPRMTAPLRTATEGEWMGLEVAPITPITGRQYQIPYGTQGLVVVEVEGSAAIAGLKAGDVVLSVNGVPISNMTNFFQATWNGTQTQGVVEVLRQGQKLAVNIAQTTNPAPAAVPNIPVNAPSGGMPTPQGGTFIYPGNAAGWGGGQGLGVGQGWGPTKQF